MARRGSKSSGLLVVAACAALWLLCGPSALDFVSASRQQERSADVSMNVGAERIKGQKYVYGERGPIPKGYGIRTGLSDLLKPLNSEYGVVSEDSIPTYIVMVTGIIALFMFYLLLLLINNQSVLLPPEDEFDEYVANFLPYFFFGEK
ncbi:unnamed protein product [Polarella glacialis]|uniref:Uncharacterized protein n=1 Tax=Polarella glacialis TaxID=89957 RepID=A0A813GFY7_POLGL|nr:unnamed protein product [Polarella glacialis]CAE8626080.1 unnamed protein product [Polarella glacialis]